MKNKFMMEICLNCRDFFVKDGEVCFNCGATRADYNEAHAGTSARTTLGFLVVAGFTGAFVLPILVTLISKIFGFNTDAARFFWIIGSIFALCLVNSIV